MQPATRAHVGDKLQAYLEKKNTGNITLKEIKLAEIAKKRRIEDEPTKQLPTGPIQRITRLPVDSSGRPYVQLTDLETDTSDLALRAVREYRRIQGCYPTVILLSSFRFLTVGMKQKSFCPEPGVFIPFGYESKPYAYDVLVRGGVN